MRPWWARQGAASDVIRPAQPAMHAFPAVLQGGELMSALGRWVLQLRWGGGFLDSVEVVFRNGGGEFGQAQGRIYNGDVLCMYVCMY